MFNLFNTFVLLGRMIAALKILVSIVQARITSEAMAAYDREV